MNRALLLSILALTVSSCSESIPNRTESPEAAFLAARAGLRNHDLRTYFDALTDQAVRDDLKNSAMICLAGANPQAVAAGLKRSVGCEAILERYSWPARAGSSTDLYRLAIAKVQDPRAMAAELETNHRKHGVGSSFVWEYLDKVRLSDLVIEGTKAHAMAAWETDDKREVRFEKDATGWRFDPMLGQR